jgi:flagellar biosynthesis GTPase FlhF
MSMENWDRFDWVGIDTPGAMNPATVAGELYGSILARNEFVRSLLLLPAAQDEAVSRRQIQQSQPYRIDGLLFGKLDEAIRPGAMVNLTMDGKNRIDSLNTGQRVPDDWHPATADSLWRWVLEPGATPAGVGA